MPNLFSIFYSSVPIVEWYSWCAKHILSTFYSVLSLIPMSSLHLSHCQILCPLTPSNFSLYISYQTHIKPLSSQYQVVMLWIDVVVAFWIDIQAMLWVVGWLVWGFRAVVG